MNETLAERELFSAVPEDDARIRRIFDAAEIAPKFALELADADELIAELARLRDLPPATTARARREAEVICLTGIRDFIEGRTSDAMMPFLELLLAPLFEDLANQLKLV